MQLGFRLTRQAIDDLDDIWTYISAASHEQASRVESAILGECEGLARHPMLGSKRSDITPLPVRFWSVTRYPSYIVVYRPDAKPVQIIAVLHGKRDIKRIIGERKTL